MYIIFSGGFTPQEQREIESWSKNIPNDLSNGFSSQGFSVGSSFQVGRLIEIPELKEELEEQERLEQELNQKLDSDPDDKIENIDKVTIKTIIEGSRAIMDDYGDYLSKIVETRFFYNKKLNFVFSVFVQENWDGPEPELYINLTKIPLNFYMQVLDSNHLRAYLSSIDEPGDYFNSDNFQQLELMETGFLSPYMACNYLNNWTAFLIEGKDFYEFRKICNFIKAVGATLQWHWRQREQEDNKVSKEDNKKDKKEREEDNREREEDKTKEDNKTKDENNEDN